MVVYISKQSQHGKYGVLVLYIENQQKERGKYWESCAKRSPYFLSVIKSFQIFKYYSCSKYEQKYNGGKIGINF